MSLRNVTNDLEIELRINWVLRIEMLTCVGLIIFEHDNLMFLLFVKKGILIMRLEYLWVHYR